MHACDARRAGKHKGRARHQRVAELSAAAITTITVAAAKLGDGGECWMGDIEEDGMGLLLVPTLILGAARQQQHHHCGAVRRRPLRQGRHLGRNGHGRAYQQLDPSAKALQLMVVRRWQR